MQANSPSSHCVALHTTQELCACGTEAVPTLAVLCKHGEQGSGPNTEEGLLSHERASVHAWTTACQDQLHQKPRVLTLPSHLHNGQTMTKDVVTLNYRH